MQERLSLANKRTLSQVIYDAPDCYLSLACYQLIDNLSSRIFPLHQGEDGKILLIAVKSVKFIVLENILSDTCDMILWCTIGKNLRKVKYSLIKKTTWVAAAKILPFHYSKKANKLGCKETPLLVSFSHANPSSVHRHY